jgi:hypothetical protein
MKVLKFLFILFGLTISAYSQKAELKSGNIIAVNNQEVCQFVTDAKHIYLYNFTNEGINIFNSKSDNYKEVKQLLLTYFSDLKMKVINNGERLPEHLNVQVSQNLNTANKETSTSSTGVIVQDNGEIKDLKVRVRASGVMSILGVTLQLVGQEVVRANPTIDNARLSMNLDRLGKVFILIGAFTLTAQSIN